MQHPHAPALLAEDLVKTYPGGRGAPPVRALDGLTLEISGGQIFGLLGPNGAGKSTIVKIFSTLSRPESGRALVAGLDVSAHADAVRQRIGLVSQKSASDPMATGRENVVLAGRIQGMSRGAARARAAELLDRFGLEDAADRLAKTYSGGMARKLDVAIGLMHSPQVLFLDEPTTGLDPQARTELWAEISRLSTDEQVTVLLTTHYLEEADRLADRLAIVDAGRVVAQGSPEELKSQLLGDTVQIECGSCQIASAAAGVLARIPGVREPAPDGSVVRARADSGARAVPAVLSALEDCGIEVSSITVARPSLDDVYLRHAGRSLKDAA